MRARASAMPPTAMPPPSRGSRGSRASRVLAEIAIGAIGLALIAGAVAANQRWLDAHFLPSFLLPHAWYVGIETGVRLAMASAGLLLALIIRPRLGRIVARSPVRALHVILAALLALAASEPILRRIHLQPTEWLVSDEEPRRRPDPHLGWTFVPSRAGYGEVAGRRVEYAFDAAGYRVRRVEEPVDPERPTILFAGESVMFGEGLTWNESVPAQVEAMMHVQSANLAVHGFATDQAYRRLEMDLPRFRKPIAIVMLFMTALFGRNLDRDRPHLGPGLSWQPGVQRWRLETLARLIVPYRSTTRIDEGIASTRDVLRATVDLAHARGAAALIVVPQFGPEEEIDRMLRHRILDESGLPQVRVDIDPSWRLAWDRHPDARAAHAMAAAIAERLERR